MKEKKIGIAFIGLGNWSNNLAKAIIATNEFKIIGGSARSDTNRENFKNNFNCLSFSSINELLGNKQVEAVIISSKNSIHKEDAIKAAMAGKHIYLEKPMALNITDAQEIIKTCENQNVKLQVGHCNRRMPIFRRAKNLIDNGKLGEISLISAHHSGFLGLISTNDSPRLDPTENPGGPLYSYSIHLADLLIHFFGEIESVSAILGKTARTAASSSHSVGALLHFKNGAIGMISGSYIASNRTEFAFEGSNGTLLLSNKCDPIFRPMPSLVKYDYENSPAVTDEIITVGNDYATGVKLALKEHFIDFAKCIRNGSDPEIGGKDGLNALAVMRTILKSHELKRTVAICEILDLD